MSANEPNWADEESRADFVNVEPQLEWQVIRETLNIYGHVQGHYWHAWSCLSFCRECIADC